MAKTSDRFSSSPRRGNTEPTGLGLRELPYNLDLEQALLASILLEGGSHTLTLCIQEKIKEESFYRPSHQIIYRHMLKLYEQQEAIDEIILADALAKAGVYDDVGGDGYIFEVTNRIDTAAHVEHYIKRVKDLSLIRQMIRLSNETIEAAYQNTQDVEEFIEKVEREVYKISEDRISETAQPLEKAVDVAIQLVNQMLNNRGEITGVTTGFADLDKMTTGWHKGEMIVCAARPSMGKTSLALNMTEGAICPKHGQPAPTLLFSLEMPADQLAMRLLCSRARVNMSKLRDGILPKDKQQDLLNTAKELKAAPLFIDDSSGLTILEIRAKARRMANQLKHGLGLVVVDYLQLVAGTDPRVPREQQIAEISRGMKGMAKELGVPVIVLAQLNRDSEKEKRQPRMSDLRESGSIEQDADVVVLISRRRDADENEEMAADSVPRDLIVAKQRNGPVGSVPVTFIKNLTRFENYSHAEV